MSGVERAGPAGQSGSGGRPVRAVLTFGVADADAAAFEAAWERVAVVVARQPGCLGQSLCRVEEPEPAYVICSDWTDPGTFRAFERSPEQDRLTSELRHLRRWARMQMWSLVQNISADRPMG